MNMNNKDLIIAAIQELHTASSAKLIEKLVSHFSLATLKRNLATLIAENKILLSGKGKSSKYSIHPSYDLFIPTDLDQYFFLEIDERKIKRQFNWVLVTNILPTLSLFTAEENTLLQQYQKKYELNIQSLSANEYNKEMERLAIDLSWKSSQIEGNTYSLLETEILLKDKQTAHGKTKEEAVMLLNHKATIDFLIGNKLYVTPLSISKIEDIHSLLVKELNVDRNIRNRRVGISGTNYQPLDNDFQIKEALGLVCDVLNNKTNVFEKAMLVLLLISYIQPFADGNKRTARIVCNAILMDNGHCPLSFRTVDSIMYKKAMLLFYEQNNIAAFKRIFIAQYEFAVKTYF
jgi:Fic family protein